MVHYRMMNGVGKCSILKFSKNPRLQQQHYSKNEVEEVLLLIIGSSGSGKSMLTNNLAYKHFLNDYVIIFITEKEGDEFANAYSLFLPEKEYHLLRLKEMGVQPTTVPTKLYHPFTFNLPPSKIPQTTIYTLSIKELEEEAFASLLTGDIDAQTVRMCSAEASRMQPTDTIYDFLWRIRDKINDPVEVIKQELNPKDMYIEIGVLGDKKALGKIRNAISSFREDFCIQPSNFKHNLDFANIINDQEHIHVLSAKWIKDRRIKFFTYLTFLRGIEKSLHKGLGKYKVLLVLEEVRVMFPKASSGEVSYEQKLAQQIVRTLNTIRSKGVNVIATTQSYYLTNNDLKTSINKRIICKLEPDDKKRLNTEYGFGLDKIEQISTLDRGEFLIWEDLDDPEREAPKYMGDVTPYMHAEAGSDFFVKYRKYYPDLMMPTAPLIKEMTDYRAQLEKKAEERLREEIRKQADKIIQKGGTLSQGRKRGRPRKISEVTEQEQMKDELELFKATAKLKKENKKMATAKSVYEQKKADSTIPWGELARRHGIGSETAKLYAFEYADRQNDEEFLKKWK